MKGLVAETIHGNLDLSFGSVIQCSWFRCMVIGMAEASSTVQVVVLGPAPGVVPVMVLAGVRLIPWRYLDDYKQVS